MDGIDVGLPTIMCSIADGNCVIAVPQKTNPLQQILQMKYDYGLQKKIATARSLFDMGINKSHATCDY